MSGQAGKIRVGVMGLGFGAEFVAIYQAHPAVEWMAVCDANPQRLRRIAEQTGLQHCYTDYAELLRCPGLDAVHVVSGIPETCRPRARGAPGWEA